MNNQAAPPVAIANTVSRASKRRLKVLFSICEDGPAMGKGTARNTNMWSRSVRVGRTRRA